MRRYPIDEVPDHPLIGALSAEQREQLALASERITLEAGETLFGAGDEATRFFMTLSGQLKLYTLSPSGQEKVVELLTQGRSFAEAVLFMPRRRYPVYCEALNRAEVCAFSASVFLDILDQSPQLNRDLLGNLSMKLRKRLADIEALAFQNATLRVSSYLLGLLDSGAEDSVMVDLPFSKKNVAARLSLQPETLSRVFSRLRQNGLIEVAGSQIRITDVAALKELTWKA